jgi:hypothetical protein
VKGDVLLALVAVFLVGWWLLSLAWHPYAACGRCKDRRGRNVGSKTTRWGTCGKCGGSGTRRRFAARQVRKGIGRPL